MASGHQSVFGIYYQILSVWELWPAQDFDFRGDKYITKKVRVVSLAPYTPTVLLFIPTKYESNPLKNKGLTTSCLDGIPFKIGTKFLPPQKVILPPGVDLLKPSLSDTFLAEYTFDVEEAVLKWSEERERQIEEQKQYEEEHQALHTQQTAEYKTLPDDTVDRHGPSHLQRLPVYENTKELQRQPVLSPAEIDNQNQPDSHTHSNGPYLPNVQVPNPLLINISNDILKPVPINRINDPVAAKKSENSVDTFDVTLFEQEDDPFDNLELQTINDLEELKTVLEETTKTSLSPQTGSGGDETDGASDSEFKQIDYNAGTVFNDNHVQFSEANKDTCLYDNMGDTGINYENSKVKTCSDLDITNLPPVPPRRDLVGRSMPLPPIRASVGKDQLNTTGNINFGDFCVSKSWNGNETDRDCHVTHSDNQTLYDNAFVKSHNAVPKPSRHFKYSRHIDEVDETDPCTEMGVVQILPKSDTGVNLGVKFHNTGSNPEQQQCGNDGIAKTRPIPAPRKTKSPPTRSSLEQSWNRYSPLPPPPVRNQSSVTSPEPVSAQHISSHDGEQAKSDDDVTDIQLSEEAKTAVGNLVSMGFSKTRVARAVQRLGSDEKEKKSSRDIYLQVVENMCQVVEYLCLVDQLTEKGHQESQAEAALLLFNNNTKKASQYLELFSQLTELGFNGDKIKEALVKTDIDREQTLDILTTS